MSSLERRCRWLLLVYPAAYRDDRGEEILGTLLEATPGNRKRPFARDVRALILGGLRARAAENRRMTTAANLRVAVLLGIAIYLGFTAASYAEDYSAVSLTSGYSQPHGVPALLAALLLAAAVVSVWFGRRPVLMCAAFSAAVAVTYCGFFQGELRPPAFLLAGSIARVSTLFLCLVALVLLAHWLERPPWAWLWLTGGIVAVFTVPIRFAGAFHASYLVAGVVLGLLVVLVAWIGIDPRPLVALAIFFVLSWLPVLVVNIAAGVGNAFDNPILLAAVGVAAFGVWRVRRQSALRTKRGDS
jgi:hypothetical protein